MFGNAIIRRRTFFGDNIILSQAQQSAHYYFAWLNHVVESLSLEFSIFYLNGGTITTTPLRNFTDIQQEIDDYIRDTLDRDFNELRNKFYTIYNFFFDHTL